MNFDKNGNLPLADTGDIAYAEGDCVPLVEYFNKLPDSLTMFGKVVTSAEVMRTAINAGFDAKTGMGRTYAGMVPVCIEGVQINLTWEV